MMWIALTTQLAAANMTVCFDDNQAQPIVDARVSHSEWGWVNSYVTDDDGCVEIVTGLGFTPVTLHAENRVVKIVNGGLPVHNVLWSVDGQTHVLAADDYLTMTELQRVYDLGLAGVGPFDANEPTGTYGASKITADLGSLAAPGSAPWVEPLVSQEAYPRLHLKSSMVTGSIMHHEMMHALHFSKLSTTSRALVPTAYVETRGSHDLDEVTNEQVAWLEGIAELGAAIYTTATDNCSTEACWSEQVRVRTDDLRDTGDDRIEGVVAGILFGEFAEDVGFDYVLQTAVDCDSLTLQDYATCIADLEGRTSETFGQLRMAADAYGVTFDTMPPGDWSYCNANYPCVHGEGDCDSDADCVFGTSCGQNVGAFYGLGSSVDVCETELFLMWTVSW